MVEDNSKQRGRAESRWVSEMGVSEQVIEERPFEESSGISPLLVAEVLDHSVFFGLGELDKSLPQFEEIALPVEMDEDTYEQYDRTHQHRLPVHH